MFKRLDQVIAVTATLAVAIISLMMLISWWLSWGGILAPLEGLPTMKANAALCMMLLAISLFLIRRYNRIVTILTSSVIVIAILSLIEHYWGVDIGLDQLLVEDTFSKHHPGRMSVAAAISLSLLAILIQGLCCWQQYHTKLFDSLFACFFCIIVAALFSYLLHPYELEQSWLFSTLSISSLLCFWLLTAAIAVKVRGNSALHLFTMNSNGAKRFRLLILYTFFVPLLLGVFILILSHYQVVDAIDGLVLFLTFAWMVIVASLAYSANREDHFYQKLNWARQRNLTLEQKLSRVMDLSGEALLLFSAEGELIHCNRGASRLFGWERDELLNMSLDELIPERLRTVHHEHVRKFLSSGRNTQMNNNPIKMLALHKDGHEVPLMTTIAKRYVGDELLIALVARDAGDIQKQINELGEKAYHDPLTTLWNRRAFDEEIQTFHPAGKRSSDRFGIVMIDLDHFKQVNDQWGHDAGDMVLKEVAKTIESCLRSSEKVYRFGGEEFVVLCIGSTAYAVGHVSKRIHTRIKKRKIHYQGHSISITCSIGYTYRNNGDGSIEEAMKRADSALYKAKAQGRDKVIAG